MNHFLVTRVIGCAVLTMVCVLRASAADGRKTIPIRLGDAHFEAGDSIVITNFQGTARTVMSKEIYAVEGTYTLGSRDEAEIAFFATVPNSGPTPVDPLQKMRVKRGSGRFHLERKAEPDGYLHVSFYPVDKGNGFGGVYFGQEPWILRNSLAAHASEGNSSSKNKLGDYLGDAVAAPADLRSPYTAIGLEAAIRDSGKAAGLTLKHVMIDESEFPFLVGVVTAEGDYEKLVAQIRKMADYEYAGSVGSSTHHTFNMTPWKVLPPESSQRIGRRLTVREQMFFDELTAKAPEGR
jgi:hypothetical protein